MTLEYLAIHLILGIITLIYLVYKFDEDITGVDFVMLIATSFIVSYVLLTVKLSIDLGLYLRNRRLKRQQQIMKARALFKESLNNPIDEFNLLPTSIKDKVLKNYEL
jgi:hypothetical protein